MEASATPVPGPSIIVRIVEDNINLGFKFGMLIFSIYIYMTFKFGTDIYYNDIVRMEMYGVILYLLLILPEMRGTSTTPQLRCPDASHFRITIINN